MHGLEVPRRPQHSRVCYAEQQSSLRTRMAEAIPRQNLLQLLIWHLKFRESMCRNIWWMDGLTQVPLILY